MFRRELRRQSRCRLVVARLREKVSDPIAFSIFESRSRTRGIQLTLYVAGINPISKLDLKGVPS